MKENSSLDTVIMPHNSTLRISSQLYAQLRALLPTLALLYLTTFMLLVIIAFVSFQGNIPISKFTRDPAAITHSPVYLGVLSNIGILLWCASAAICFYTFSIMRKNGSTTEFTELFLFSGCITSLLLLDDLFLFHDRLIPKYFDISEEIVFLSYLMIVLFYLFRFRIQILKTEFILLFLAFVFFTLSLIVDALPKNLLPMQHLFEDGAKLFGIVSWFGYFVRVSFQVVRLEYFNKEFDTRTPVALSQPRGTAPEGDPGPPDPVALRPLVRRK